MEDRVYNDGIGLSLHVGEGGTNCIAPSASPVQSARSPSAEKLITIRFRDKSAQCTLQKTHMHP